MMPGHGVTLLLPGGVTGVLGLVKPEIPDTWRITDPVGVLEVPRSVLLASTGARQRVQPLTPYPSVTRDVALVVAQSVQHQQVVDVMRAAAPPELEDIALFDIFEGKGVGPGRKSMAYSLRYRSASGTLTDGDANQYHDVVKEALKAQLAAEIREH
jgi:phenylalanyl-tRNA synthetase beta chain